MAQPIFRTLLDEPRAEALANTPYVARMRISRASKPTAGPWIFVISFIKVRDSHGNPLIAPGDWIGITIDPEGHVIDTMAGD